MIRVGLKYLFMLVILSVYCSSSSAISLAELVRGEQIIATSYINVKEPSPISAQIILTIDISIPLDARFSQATKINHFEIADAVVLAQGPFALNSVSNINGKKYVNQLWEIPIYPQAAGDYLIPPIIIEMGILHKGETITGKLLTSPLTFSTFIPSAYITDEYHWVVANKATLEETLMVTHVHPGNDDANEKPQLFVGDAIEREVIMTVQDSLAMLLPTLINVDDYQEIGSKPYLSQGQYFDKEVRGKRVSSHTEKITLVVQEAGRIVLPEIEVVWWDLESNSEMRLTLESQTWQVKHTFSSYVKAYWIWILVFAFLLSILIVGLYRLSKEIKHRKETDTMPLWYQFSHAIKGKDWARSESVIYRKIKRDHHRLTICYASQNGDWKKSAEQLQSTRYQSSSSIPLNKSLFVQLWEKLGNFN